MQHIATPIPLAPRLAGTLLLAALALPALGADRFDLTFSGDGTFNTPHGDQAIQVAVYDVTAGETVATQSGRVAGLEDPAFSFTFEGVLESGRLYDVHYWIDSNFGGGSEGQCDPVNVDHQWRQPLPHATEAITLEVAHRPAAQAPVCASFE